MGVGARGLFEVQRAELRDPEHGRTPRGTTRRLLGAALYGALITGIALVNAGCSGIVASNSQASPSSFTITTSSLPAAQTGTAYQATLSASGGATPYSWSLASGSLPGGLSLNSSSGAISGMPSASGTSAFSVKVTDSASKTTQQALSIIVSASGGGALGVLNSALAGGQVGQSYAVILQATGGTPSYSWSITSGQLPAGLALGVASGLISGTPTATGQFNFTVRVKDSASSPQTSSKTLNIGVVSSSSTLDQYGGLLSAPSPNGATGHFRMEKFGSRWSFVTPDGNAFPMLGVYHVAGDSRNDELGNSYTSRFQTKYGSDQTGWLQVDRRLKSWGFNTIGPYSYRMTMPLDSETQWGGLNPLPMPVVLIENPSGGCAINQNNLAPGPCKSIIATTAYNGRFPDVFDPNFDAYVAAAFATDTFNAAYYNSPWLLGIMVDDTDYLGGFGPGTDFTTSPAKTWHLHLGWISLVTSPTQTSNAFNNTTYIDKTVYTKKALHDFLVAKYGTISALNTAWGSTYTTFDSAGGWKTGTGLMDEGGQNTTWVGTDPYALSGTSAGCKADLDTFLLQLAKQYFSIVSTQVKKVAPTALYFGPTNIGAWAAPPRRQILQAAGQYVDVINTGASPVQAQLDFMAQYAGDKPIAYWLGATANADSGRWRYPDTAPNSVYSYSSQSARGQYYASQISNYLNTATTAGVKPSVGMLWWEWKDNLGEEQNWGLASYMDNAYDGLESTVSGSTTPGVVGSSTCVDIWGYHCGAEEKNYGDFITAVRTANQNLLSTWPK